MTAGDVFSRIRRLKYNWTRADDGRIRTGAGAIAPKGLCPISALVFALTGERCRTDDLRHATRVLGLDFRFVLDLSTAADGGHSQWTPSLQRAIA